MDRGVIRRRAATVGLILLGWAAASIAQPLADPTRPPTAVDDGRTGEPAPEQLQLQSVLISSGRRLAIINGDTVPLGGRLGDATVVRITETEVALKRDDGMEVLKLTPGIEKRYSSSQKTGRGKMPRNQGSPR